MRCTNVYTRTGSAAVTKTNKETNQQTSKEINRNKNE